MPEITSRFTTIIEWEKQDIDLPKNNHKKHQQTKSQAYLMHARLKKIFPSLFLLPLLLSITLSSCFFSFLSFFALSVSCYLDKLPPLRSAKVFLLLSSWFVHFFFFGQSLHIQALSIHSFPPPCSVGPLNWF